MTTKDFIEQNIDGIVNITPEISYSTRDVIRRDRRLQNGQYEEKYFADGDEKPFMRMIFVLARSAKQNTDFDSRNFDATAANQESIEKVGLFKAGLKNYLNYSGYSKFLNESGDQLIDDGHVILKKCDDGKPKYVDLLKVVRPPNVEGFDGGIAEQVDYTFEELLSKKDDMTDENWKMIEDLKDQYDTAGEHTGFIGWEYWKWEDFEGKRTITCTHSLDVNGSTPSDPNPDGNSLVELDKFETPHFEEITSKAELKKLKKAGIIQKGNKKPIFPYVEGGLFKVSGRWKYMGYYELLAVHQELYNQTWMQKVRHDEQRRNGTMVYKKSRDNEDTLLTQEWLDNIDTGGVFPIWNDESVDSLRMESMTSDFIVSLDKIFEIARLLSGVTPQRSGEDVAVATATGVITDEKIAESTFAYIKERKEIMYKELFEKFEFDSIRDDMTEEDAVSLLGDRDELDAIMKPYMRNLIRKKIKEGSKDPQTREIIAKLTQEGAELPPEVEEELILELQDKMAEKGSFFADFKKDLFKDIKLRMHFFSYDETFSKNIKIQQLDKTISTVANLPTTNISIDKLLKQQMELLDNRKTDIEKSPQQIAEEKKAAEMERQAQLPQAQLPQAPQ